MRRAAVVGLVLIGLVSQVSSQEVTVIEVIWDGASDPVIEGDGGIIIGDGLPPALFPDPLPAPFPSNTSWAANVSAEDTSAAIGFTFEVPVHADTGAGVEEISYTLFWDPSAMSLESWRPGAAIDAYAEDADPPDCDIFVYPEEGRADVETIFYAGEFDAGEHGTEVLVFELKADSPAPEDSAMLLADVWGNFDIACVHIFEGAPFLRGDVNADLSQGLLDGLAVLEYLFDDDALDCERAGDLDDDGQVGLDDALSLLSCLFGDGDPPPATCELDPDEDALPCDETGCE